MVLLLLSSTDTVADRDLYQLTFCIFIIFDDISFFSGALPGTTSAIAFLSTSTVGSTPNSCRIRHRLKSIKCCFWNLVFIEVEFWVVFTHLSICFLLSWIFTPGFDFICAVLLCIGPTTFSMLSCMPLMFPVLGALSKLPHKGRQ